MAGIQQYVVVFILHVAAAKIYEKCELARELVYKYDFKKVKKNSHSWRYPLYNHDNKG